MEINYKYITTKEQLDEAIDYLLSIPVLAYDSETEGLDCHLNKTSLIQISSNEIAYLFDCYTLPIKYLALKINQVITDKILILQNGKFDIKFGWKLGIDLSNSKWLFDTYLVAKVVENCVNNDKQYGLNDICERYLDTEVDKTEQTSDWSIRPLTDKQLYYAAKDVLILHPLRIKLKEKIKETNTSEVLGIEFKALPGIASMEYFGIKLDTEKWTNLIPLYKQKIVEFERLVLEQLPNVYYQYTFNGEIKYSLKISSAAAQLTPKLQELGIPDPEEEGKLLQRSGKDKLKLLDLDKYTIVDDILEFRKYNKGLSSFIVPFTELVHPVTGNIHFTLWQLGTLSGRFSSSNPKKLGAI